MGITTSAMTQLRARLKFIQMRFHCSKEQGRTFHVITAANSTGEAVVQYFSGQSDTLPASCGSFITMEDDNSELAKKCSKWGNDRSHYVGKWGHYNKQREFRMYDHTAFIANLHHWIIFDRRGKCDEGADEAFSKGDFWKIFVRWCGSHLPHYEYQGKLRIIFITMERHWLAFRIKPVLALISTRTGNHMLSFAYLLALRFSDVHPGLLLSVNNTCVQSWR